MSNGHAAVGMVVGTRTPDGHVPKLVDIVYRRNGEQRTARVRRESAGQQVEFSDSDTSRFWTPDGSVILVDELLDVEPVTDA